MGSNSSLAQLTNWNKLIKGLPNSHLLQTSQWADLKAQFGWRPSFMVWEEDLTSRHFFHEGNIKANAPVAAGLLLERQAFPGLRVLYMPKGPLLVDWSDQALCQRVLDDLADYSRVRGAIQLKIDPDIELGRGIPGEEEYQLIKEGEEFQQLLSSQGWVRSQEQIQFKNTVLVDILEEEDQILARMKSKTRYNIRLAGRKGIQTRLGSVDDLLALYRMYAETSRRAGFTIRGESYYLSLWKLFMEAGGEEDPKAQPILAEFDGTLVAGAVIFIFGNRAWYLHGMSLPEHSEKMAPHLIQWEAMRWAKSQGCKEYDMWGAPERFDESDPLWGVYRFKRGFGGDVSLTIGAWDYPSRRIGYTAYNRWLPKVLDLMRWFGDRRTGRAARLVE